MSKYDKLIKENKARRENVQDQQRIIKGGMGEMAADARRTAAILGNAHDELSEIDPQICVNLQCGASILHHIGGLHKFWDGLMEENTDYRYLFG